MECIQLLLPILLCVFCVQCANKTFVPTDDWQTIDEGMEVPAGLHVRINLQTGKKEAKLIKGDKSNKHTALTPSKNENTTPTTEELKELLKLVENDHHDSKSFRKNRYRSYEDIHNELDDFGILVKTDMEILHNLMEEFRSVRNKSITVENIEERLEAIINDLNELVHQYDNGMEFARSRGFEELIVPSLNSSEDGALLRSSMLKLVGSATQNNPRVQKAAIESGFVPLLLRILEKDEDITVRTRTVTALSSILRQNPAGLVTFLKQGGLPVFAAAFDDSKRPDNRIRFKIINLMTDWLREIRSVSIAEKHIERSYEAVLENFGTRDGGWCSRAADWFILTAAEPELEHGMIEAAATFLIELANQDCADDLRINLDLMLAVNITKQLYEDLALQDQDEGKTESYFLDILVVLRHLLAILAGNMKYKDEL